MQSVLKGNKDIDTHIRREVAKALPNLTPDEMEREIKKAKGMIASGNGQYSGIMDGLTEQMDLTKKQQNLLASRTRGGAARERLRARLKARQEKKEGDLAESFCQRIVDNGVKIKSIGAEELVECMANEMAEIVVLNRNSERDENTIQGIVNDSIFTDPITVNERRGRRRRKITYASPLRLMFACYASDEFIDPKTTKPNDLFFDKRSSANVLSNDEIVRAMGEETHSFYYNNRIMTLSELLTLLRGPLSEHYKQTIMKILLKCMGDLRKDRFLAVLTHNPHLKILAKELELISNL